ncbi:hypothetical protein EVG20_g6012 [Dentipellis fragilis]|uniref:Uncharacterized protein n=1 Tax=Dentipellis fragilis TaxID=205917 RepID=A0A4Y9YRR0_9AGAM|nr:hypothetical protein EVG20_g6012 [Dentipellis fragilis]
MSSDHSPSANLSSGFVCTPEELAQSSPNSTNIYCLTRGQSIGLTVSTRFAGFSSPQHADSGICPHSSCDHNADPPQLTSEAGFISLFSVLILFGLIVRNVIRYRRDAIDPSWRLLDKPLDIYMLSLFCLDFVQALGSVLDVKWVNEGKVYSGTFCSAQGAIQQLGETGVAMTTFVIAVHTFVTAVWKKGVHSRFVAFCIVGFIWLYVILFTSIGLGLHATGDNRWDTPTPYWCWIGQQWKVERIFGEYLWLWITLGTSIVVYIPLFLWSQGIMSVDEHRWWRFHMHPLRKAQDFEPRRRFALSMLAYPLSYSVLVLPLSIVRWLTFNTGGSVPSAATFVVITLYGLSGMVNVLLLLLTRPRLLLFSEPLPTTSPIRAPLPEPPRPPSKGYRPDTVGSQQPIRMGTLKEDGRWKLPLVQGSVASSYDSVLHIH